jgi:acetoin utilization protein AcuC
MRANCAKPRAVLVYSDEQSRLDMGPTHPLKPVRLRHAYNLMAASGVLSAPNVREAAPKPASQQEIERYHAREYVEVVKAVSRGEWSVEMASYGFGVADNPPVPGIYEAAALVAGGSILACDLVVSDQADAAFAMAGGVHHHAMAARASGFGVFNDAVIAIKGLVECGLRVAYVDIDCHHGDGVQAGFYDDPRVLTVSIHESGQFLFPGTGFVNEIGYGPGDGYAVNIPLAPYTTDDVWLKTFDDLVPAIVRAFRPDLLFCQLGIDTHYKDPITHMRLTTQGFAEAVHRLKSLGDECPRGWVAAGGGGYDMGAVARAWTMAFAIMAEFDLPVRTPDSFKDLNGLTTFADEPPPALAPDIEAQITSYAERVTAAVQELVFPKFGLK